ncbi:MAG: cache and HAMP domain-containing protein, partial [Gemmatimonadetes bacterium]|nr:cache and HAMP domain-containing protein [Gemmatimonadota bacterium]
MSPWESQMARLLTALRLESIRNKIVTLAVAATLIPTLTTALVSYAQNSRSLADQLDQDLSRSVTQTALELDLWLAQQLIELAGLETSYVVSENLENLSAGGPGRHESAARLAEYVSAVGPRMPDFDQIIILDGEGVAIASSKPGSPSGMSDAWAQSVVAGAEGFDDPHRSASSGELFAYAGSSVRSPTTGAVIGGLVARVRLQPVTAMLETNVPSQGGRLLLLSGDETIVSSSDGDRDPVPWGDTAAAPLSTPATVVEYVDELGERVLVSATAVGGPDLSVAVELPRNLAYAPLHNLRNVTLGLVALLLTVIGSVAYFLGQAIVRPLARLTSGASEVAAGDFSVELPTVGGGEVSALTEVFNDMVRRLQDGRRA